MSSPTKSPPPAFGFLTVVEQTEWGLVGGYLVVNAGGRPFEFHCTAPVKANRAQEILYGPTLKPYLCGEQIGQALLSKAKVEPLLVFTDLSDVFPLREFISVPVVLVDVHDTNLEANRKSDLDSATLHTFKLEKLRVAIENRFSSDQPTVLDRWQSSGQTLDVTEPFGRIRTALEEAQKSARAAA
jgi:hypothetical protein